MKLTHMKLTTLVVCCLLVAGAACSTDDPTLSPAPRSQPSATPSPQATDPSPASGLEKTFTVEVWWTDRGRLVAGHATAVRTPQVAAAALASLLADDPATESAIPPGTDLGVASIDEGIARVEVGSAELDRLARAQIVFTLTQFSTIEKVTFGSDKPVGRDDFEDLAPPIIVSEPQPGAAVFDPFTITGTANVFEANVSIRIVGEDGQELVSTFTTATCGTGCRGDYEKRISLEVTSPTEIVIEVFESSAEDGSPLHVVEVPVTVLP